MSQIARHLSLSWNLSWGSEVNRGELLDTWLFFGQLYEIKAWGFPSQPILVTPIHQAHRSLLSAMKPGGHEKGGLR